MFSILQPGRLYPPALPWAAVFFCLCAFGVRADDKINYVDHVAPLIEANCSKCHNPDKKKADLDLTSYQATLKGSGSGLVVASGNPDASKLWKALTHAEEPYMPPNRPKLPDKELEVFKEWIAGGLLESAGGKAVAVAKPGFDLALNPDDLGKLDGPAPMPQQLPTQSVLHAEHVGPVVGLAASPWAPLVAIAGLKQVLLYHTESRELLGILPFNEGEPCDLKFSQNGKLLVAGGGWGAKSGCVVIWDVVSGKRVMTLGHEYDSVLASDIRADQSMVALGGPDRLVKMYSTKTGELLHKIKKHTDWVTAIAFSPNGQFLASADRNGGISLWDPDSGQELFTLAGHKASITSLSWRADSKLLASSSEDGAIKIWEPQEGKQIKSWNGHAQGVLSVGYSRNGQLVSCGRDNAVTVWDGNGTRKRNLEFFGNLPLRAVFSEDNSRIIATDFGGRCAEWAASDGKRVGELDVNPVPSPVHVSTEPTKAGSGVVPAPVPGG
ncbi:MAG TPA: c-type cytochrome domain-containing protein [Verrucomicrobiae bacterium]|nr:c-type cytochrome domain-containing protein [Verrucomicrobiae bacterium]